MAQMQGLPQPIHKDANCMSSVTLISKNTNTKICMIHERLCQALAKLSGRHSLENSVSAANTSQESVPNSVQNAVPHMIGIVKIMC